jgi:hypothetical protein
MTELTADSAPGAEEAKKTENSQDASKKAE